LLVISISKSIFTRSSFCKNRKLAKLTYLHYFLFVSPHRQDEAASSVQIGPKYCLSSFLPLLLNFLPSLSEQKTSRGSITEGNQVVFPFILKPTLGFVM